MLPEIGSVLEGKVTGVTKFGAFVALPGGLSGLVHISELSNTYVSDVSQHVQPGQDLRVKVIRITDDGKINLSVKQLQAPAERPQRQYPDRNREQPYRKPVSAGAARPVSTQQPERNETPSGQLAAESPVPNADFEDRLKKFMKESDSRIADNKYYQDRGKRSRRR